MTIGSAVGISERADGVVILGESDVLDVEVEIAKNGRGFPDEDAEENSEDRKAGAVGEFHVVELEVLKGVVIVLSVKVLVGGTDQNGSDHERDDHQKDRHQMREAAERIDPSCRFFQFLCVRFFNHGISPLYVLSIEAC